MRPLAEWFRDGFLHHLARGEQSGRLPQPNYAWPTVVHSLRSRNGTPETCLLFGQCAGHCANPAQSSCLSNSSWRSRRPSGCGRLEPGRLPVVCPSRQRQRRRNRRFPPRQHQSPLKHLLTVQSPEQDMSEHKWRGLRASFRRLSSFFSPLIFVSRLRQYRMSSVVCPNPIGLNVVVVEIRQVVSVGFRKMVRTDPLPGRNIRDDCIVMSGGNRGCLLFGRSL